MSGMNPPDSFEKLARDVLRCRRCPRLVAFREEVASTRKAAFRDETYWGRPVPGFGDPAARVLIVGLAPAPHGANRTGRMFTGDGTDGMGASDFLARALHRTGFASQPTSRRRGDGFELTGAYLTALARCAPPGNRPLSEEIANCRPFLERELDLLASVRVVVALGKAAFDEVLGLLGARGASVPRPRPRFCHGARYDPGAGLPVLLGSYHPSRQNTQTGKLNARMLEEVFRRARSLSGRA
jgi:uracil-DNA glycosylase family 4